MKLVLPSIVYKDGYLQALEESKNENTHTILRPPKENETFEEFVQDLLNESKGINLPKDFVPATDFWLIDNDEFIGRVNIRHTLNETLFKQGGHIGYWIRPSKRGMGYGKEILRLALEKAKELGITDALVTCDRTNLGSIKIIEENGGILESAIDDSRRYRIDLA